MARYYCPQWADDKKGWTDLPEMAAKHEFAALRSLESWLNEEGWRNPPVNSPYTNPPQTRVIRKPHGWRPNVI